MLVEAGLASAVTLGCDVDEEEGSGGGEDDDGGGGDWARSLLVVVAKVWPWGSPLMQVQEAQAQKHMTTHEQIVRVTETAVNRTNSS